MTDKNNHLRIAPDVKLALENNHPVVALESTVISHGLPYPDNYNLACECEAVIRDQGGVPATIAILDRKMRVGLTDDEIKKIATEESVRKISRRDMGIAISKDLPGGTTVASTMIIAHKAGIKVFATGGIGGVHRGDDLDISADLPELSQTPVAVVCAGAKSILDLPRTLEYLETMGVPVIGFQTDTFPAFYASSSGLPVDERCDTFAEIADVIQTHWDLGFSSGVLVVVPPPVVLALSQEDMETAIEKALDEAGKHSIKGKEITPFLLEKVSKLTHGRSKKVNIALLKQNARVAAQIAMALHTPDNNE